MVVRASSRAAPRPEVPHQLPGLRRRPLRLARAAARDALRPRDPPRLFRGVRSRAEMLLAHEDMGRRVTAQSKEGNGRSAAGLEALCARDYRCPICKKSIADMRRGATRLSLSLSLFLSLSLSFSLFLSLSLSFSLFLSLSLSFSLSLSPCASYVCMRARVCDAAVSVFARARALALSRSGEREEEGDVSRQDG